ncbi:CPBP family intramembrane glutamic endopeptidase [Aureitalea marina]|uniref:CAAX prenyl protease 2/Lysostaphin resistance protein A-like domain-containing protein n=1 Tax=Aureitalea marina TaxID=930804 RepID=A0A2S7KSH4_9FLAO|nr:CPBP family intramembrane glutamic endopeptidase [Aureitalea marina]PQB05570.1 hypothetical protein BST85_12175 [Aureitalea marina]
MKSLFVKYPSASRFVLAILMFAAVLIVSPVIDGPYLKQYFPYLSAILLVGVTWFLLKLDGTNLTALGLNISWRNCSFILVGILIGALAFLFANLARSLYTGETMALSANIDYQTILSSFYLILPTVAVEELIFRGYLFKKTIAISNVIVANIVFSVLFMLVHVIDGEVLESPGRMVMLVISIPVGHLMFATALLRSGTLFFPIGLHLGNNWATRHLISSMDDGQSILFVLERVNFDTWPSFIGLLLIYNGVFLLLTWLIWKWRRGSAKE